MQTNNVLELTPPEIDLVSGGEGGFNFGPGPVPGFGDGGPAGARVDYSFGNGWSLSGGSTFSGSHSGIQVRFVWF